MDECIEKALQLILYCSAFAIIALQMKHLVRRLKLLIQTNILDLDGQAIATVLYCFSKLSFKDDGLIGDLMHVSLQQLQGQSARALGTIIYAVAGLELNPSRRWMACFYQVSAYMDDY